MLTANMKGGGKFYSSLLGGANSLFAGVSAVIIAAFLFSVIAIAINNNSQKENLRLRQSLLEESGIFSIYVVSGKIMDIQGRTIILETPVFDSQNKRWDNDKKETRKLTVDNETKLWKERLVMKKKDNYEIEGDYMAFEDLRVGEYVSASYSKSILEVHDFIPTVVTVLANQSF